MLRKYIDLYKELIEQIKNQSASRKNKEMEAYGLRFVGQGYMIDGYSLMNHDDFFSSLKKEVDFVKSYKRKENISIIDAGANLGFYSIVYALMDNTNVTSFEPFPDTYLHLEKNIKSNNIPNIQPLQVGLFSKNVEMPIGSPDAFNFYGFLTKIMKFTDKEQLGCYSGYTSDNKAPIAKFTKGDDCKYLFEKENIDFIKIDVEGSESEVIKGLEGIINKHRPVLKIEFNLNAFSAAGITCQEIWRYLIQQGYKQYTICSKGNDFKHWLSMDAVPVLNGADDILFID